MPANDSSLDDLFLALFWCYEEAQSTNENQRVHSRYMKRFYKRLSLADRRRRGGYYPRGVLQSSSSWSSCRLYLHCFFMISFSTNSQIRIFSTYMMSFRTSICFNPSSFLFFSNLDIFLAFLDLVICNCDTQILCSVSLSLTTSGQMGYLNWPNDDVSRPFKALSRIWVVQIFGEKGFRLAPVKEVRKEGRKEGRKEANFVPFFVVPYR